MTREALKKLTVGELKSVCKRYGIRHYRGKTCFRKDELIEAIVEHNEGVKESKSDEAAESSADINMDQKMRYIESADVGTLVAFRLPNGKVKSAKIVKRSTKERKLMLETSYSAKYVVRYEDILWVRHGAKWPSGVYRLLKGLESDERKTSK